MLAEHRHGLVAEMELTEAQGYAERGASRGVRRCGDAPATPCPAPLGSEGR